MADQVVVMRAGRVEQAGTPQEVFDHPANAFIMDFLGNVNVFHGRVQNGRALLGGVEVDCPDYPHDESRSAAVYVRPHELHIDRAPAHAQSLKARVQHVNPAGSVARVELLAVDLGVVIQADVPPDRFAELGLKNGDEVYVSPRRVRVYVPEYAI